MKQKKYKEIVKELEVRTTKWQVVSWENRY
jgi:hypothetical protein